MAPPDYIECQNKQDDSPLDPGERATCEQRYSDQKGTKQGCETRLYSPSYKRMLVYCSGPSSRQTTERPKVKITMRVYDFHTTGNEI